MTIKINIPVSYRIHGFLPGRKQPRSYIFAEIKPIEIEEASPSQAEIAIAWTDAPYQVYWEDNETTQVSPADGLHYTRYMDGTHWVRLLAGQAGYVYGPSEPLRTFDFLQTAENGGHIKTLGFTMPTQGQKTISMVDSDPSDRFQSISKTTRDTAMRHYEALRLLSVDGTLYMACSQPAYLIRSASTPGGVKARIPVIHADTGSDNRSITERSAILPFSAETELEELLKGLTWSQAEIFRRPLIHLPESISRDDDLIATADYHLREFFLASYRRLNAPYAYVDNYFKMGTAEEKAAYLARSADEWERSGRQFGLPVERLSLALECLDNVSVTLDARPANTMHMR